MERGEEIMVHLTGWVHGNTITLDAPVTPFESMRVLVRIKPVRDDLDTELPSELPDLSEFRASLGAKPYPGNSVVDLREEERS